MQSAQSYRHTCVCACACLCAFHLCICVQTEESDDRIYRFENKSQAPCCPVVSMSVHKGFGSGLWEREAAEMEGCPVFRRPEGGWGCKICGPEHEVRMSPRLHGQTQRHKKALRAAAWLSSQEQQPKPPVAPLVCKAPTAKSKAAPRHLRRLLRAPTEAEAAADLERLQVTPRSCCTDD